MYSTLRTDAGESAFRSVLSYYYIYHRISICYFISAEGGTTGSITRPEYIRPEVLIYWATSAAQINSRPFQLHPIFPPGSSLPGHGTSPLLL
jgi:hypothetical protein